MKKLERIMLIDDDSDTNFYNKIVLEREDASNEIIVFQNGKEALNFIKEENTKIDLIFLDINMPVMSGWQFLEHYEILEKEKQTAIIVIMLTSSANFDDKKRAESFRSVKKYINKPLNSKLIKEILSLFE